MNTAIGRAAAVSAWLAGLMFGLPCVFGIVYFARHGTVWMFMGFPAYGYGPFEDAGLPTTVPVLVAFLLVCVAEMVTGWLLWRRRRAGVALALGLLPFELAFWIGFALPFGFVFGAARTALVIFLLAQARGGPERLRPDAGTRGRSPARSTRAAAVLTWVYAACFGIPAIPVAVYLRQHGTLPWFGDLFQMYGGPWSLRVGIDAFTVRLIAFLALMLVAAWTGWLMWRGSTLGAVANLALLPVEAVFWAGFALPVPWVIGLARATLIAVSWLAQKRRAPAHSPDPLGSPAAGTGPSSDAGGTKNAPE